MMNMQAIALVKQFEGCRRRSYPDSGGKYTIGWGHTGKEVVPGLEWTQEEADAQLIKDVDQFEELVKESCKAPITDNQLAALTSFAYNVGPINFKRSGVLRAINQFKFKEAADHLLLWNKSGSYVLEGLTKRRQAERALFLKG